MVLYDFANLLVILVLIICLFRIGIIPLWLSFFLALSAFIPFLLNDVLFSAMLMSDQYGYLTVTQEIRSNSSVFQESSILWAGGNITQYSEGHSPTLSWTGQLFALIPLPYVETIQSLGFFNRFIATILISWLYFSKRLRGWPLLFVIFYPSFLLYSSLTLRDTLILLFMIVSVILFIEKRRLVAIVIALPLVVIKLQNFALIIIFFIIHLSFSKDSFFYRLRYLLIPGFLLALSPFVMELIELLNFYRRAFHLGDGGDLASYVPINGLSDFFVIATQAVPYFFFKPMIWEASNVLQLIQSLENFIVTIFIIFLFIKAFKINRSLALKWLAFLIISFAIYGLVVSNFGTAARYRFPFILTFVIGIAYELYLKHGMFILNNSVKNKATL